ncbi:chaplin family protein [Streptomyces sp. NPDC053048]|uniref:chaplin family protein n=1 Tax=Streptomyces sp. NPDC053048 TaxID=3365694 RepID=UPI0037D1F8B3
MSAATRARRVRKRAVLVGTGLGAVALSAVPAQAIISIGNPTSGNVCANAGGPRAAGATRSSTGTVAGNTGQLPLGLPRNHCGNSGLTCMVTSTEDDGAQVVVLTEEALHSQTLNVPINEAAAGVLNLELLHAPGAQ